MKPKQTSGVIKLGPVFSRTTCIFPKCKDLAVLGVNEGVYCAPHGALGLRATFGLETRSLVLPSRRPNQN